MAHSNNLLCCVPMVGHVARFLIDVGAETTTPVKFVQDRETHSIKLALAEGDEDIGIYCCPWCATALPLPDPSTLPADQEESEICCAEMADRLSHSCFHCEEDAPDLLVIRTITNHYGIMKHDEPKHYLPLDFCPWCGDELAHYEPEEESSVTSQE